jgi:hypothetical protein
MRLGGSLSKKGVAKSISICLVVVLISISIAVIPLLQSLEDYFVNGLSYNSTQIPLFASLPDKEKHFNVIQAYFGRMKQRSLKWKLIRSMTSMMFTRNYNYDEGVVSNANKFYGNDGVCLFKYFVVSDDPQMLYVWLVLLINFLCFFIISLSYIFIASVSGRSARILSIEKKNKVCQDRNDRTNRKITIIILTDFCCWIPFIVTCGLHTLGIIDATPWYGLFSIVVLPINSVVNPILYDSIIPSYTDRIMNSLKRTVAQISHSIGNTNKNKTIESESIDLQRAIRNSNRVESIDEKHSKCRQLSNNVDVAETVT